MAQGTLTLFNEFALSKGDGRIDLDSHTFKAAWVTLQVGGTPTIAADDAVPCWGAGGTTDLSAAEVAAGGGYAAGGITLTGITYTLAGAVATFDCNDLAWVSASSGDPDTAKTLIVYDDTATNKDAVGFMDLTTDGTTAISLLAGDVNIGINATGLFTTTVNA